MLPGFDQQHVTFLFISLNCLFIYGACFKTFLTPFPTPPYILTTEDALNTSRLGLFVLA